MPLPERLADFWNVFSLRRGAQRPGYRPDEVSERLRNRILMLYVDLITGRLSTGNYVRQQQNHAAEFWAEMHHALRTAYGKVRLTSLQTRDPAQDAGAFVEKCSPAEFFDFIEASFKLECAWRIFSEENEFVDALNGIFRLESAPYQVTYGAWRPTPAPTSGPFTGLAGSQRTAYPTVVRVDEQVPHAEAVAPALSALADPAYAGADHEFRKALQDYRDGEFADCLGKCGSAFESVLKVLCAKNKIPFDPLKDTAGNLIPSALAKSTLDAGTFQEPFMLVARMRNRLSSSHGGGSKVRTVDRHVAQYAVTATAAAIVLLVQDMG
jgi:hypothetical protein